MITYLKQHRRFRSLRRQLPDIYSRLQALGSEPFVLPFWDGVNKKIAKVLMPSPQSDFLGIRAIKDTMFVAGSEHWLQTQVHYLQNVLGASYSDITREDPIGKPSLLPAPNARTSHNTLHHLYHLYFFMEKTGTTIHDIDHVVEWGGGYGNFAKLWYRLAEGKATYTIIDTSLFCSIQWLYLSSVLGADAVHLLDHERARIKKGKINIV